MKSTGFQHGVVTKISAEEKTPLHLPEEISIVRIRLDYYWRPLSNTVIHKYIHLKRKKGITTAHNVAGRYTKDKLSRFFFLFEYIQVIHGIGFQISEIPDNLF